MRLNLSKLLLEHCPVGISAFTACRELLLKLRRAGRCTQRYLPVFLLGIVKKNHRVRSFPQS